VGSLIIGLGILGMIVGIYGLATTISTERATLRGGRKITRAHNPTLYWANVAAIGVLILISAGLIYLGAAPNP
jgi:hypothetical protein